MIDMDNYATKRHLDDPVLLKKDLSILWPDTEGFSAAEVTAERIQNLKRDVAVEIEALTSTQMLAYNNLIDDADHQCRQLYHYDIEHLNKLWDQWHNLEPPSFALMTYIKILTVIILAAGLHFFRLLTQLLFFLAV